MRSHIQHLARAIADWRCDPDRTISPPDMPLLGLATDEPELYALYARLSPAERQYVYDYARRAAMLATDIAVLGPQEVADAEAQAWDAMRRFSDEFRANLERANRHSIAQWCHDDLARHVDGFYALREKHDHAVDAIRYAVECQRRRPAQRPKLVPGVWVRLIVIAAGSSALWALWHWLATGERVGP